MKPTTTPTISSDEAVDWLAGRIRWERILRSLHERAEGKRPVASRVELVATTEPDGTSDQADAAA